MAKSPNNLYLGISEPLNVDLFLLTCSHPMLDVLLYLRKLILGAHKEVGEGIYWNAPTFFFTGQMEPFGAKTYNRYVVGFVLNRQDCVRLVFLHGANVAIERRILEGNYADGRRLITFTDMADAKAKANGLKAVVTELIEAMK